MLGNPKHWPAEAWYGVLGALAWATVTALVGLARTRFDPSWLDAFPTLVEWILITVGLSSITSLTIQVIVLRRRTSLTVSAERPDFATEVATIVTQQIGEEVANRRYRIIPIDAKPPNPPPFERDGFLIWARTEPVRLSWGDMREDLQVALKPSLAPPAMRPLPSYFPSAPVWVTVTIRKQEQGFSTGLRLKFTEAKMRAGRFSTGVDSTVIGPSGPDLLELMDDGAAPREQMVMVNDLKTGESWFGEFLCDGASWSNEPSNFGWILTGSDGLRISGSLRDILRD